MNDVFLDSTAIIDRAFSDKETRIKLKNKLNEYQEVYSSKYVLSEIINGYLKFIVTGHAKTKFMNSYFEFGKWVQHLNSNPFQKYRAAAIFDQIFIFMDEMEESIKKHNSEDIKIDKLQLLRDHLQTLLDKAEIDLKEGAIVNKYIDETLCWEENMKFPKGTNDGFYYIHTDTKCYQHCEIDKFFISKEKYFENILISLKALNANEMDEETKGRKAALNKILDNKSKKRKLGIDRKICRECSDAIIAVESNSNKLLNNNTKHYDDICKSIGKISVSYK